VETGQRRDEEQDDDSRRLKNAQEQNGKRTERKERSVFKIGDFSRLSQVTVKALRYYDELGLLKPAHVDRFTGYRYYSATQLPRLNRILALKDLGFALEQMACFLDQHGSPEQIRGMLHLRRSELEQHIEEEQARLARVEARLRQIEEEDTMPTYDVVIKKVEPQTIVGIRRVIPTYPHVGELFGELFGHIQAHNVRVVGPPLSIYYDGEYRERDVDVEAAVPVGAPGGGANGVPIRELPGAEMMASLVHHGPYETIHQAYSALLKWIEQNHYRVDGPDREIYLQGPDKEKERSPEAYVTELQVPVAKVEE
jgi:effector-binding domain-containing protein